MFEREGREGWRMRGRGGGRERGGETREEKGEMRVKSTKHTILEWKGILRSESPRGKTTYVFVLYLVYH